MGPPLGGLAQIVEILHPNTLKQLRNAGTLTTKSPLAVGAALPWLLGRGPSLAILCHMNAITAGNKPAIHDRSGTITWDELNKRVNRVANALASVGVEPGDHVALLLRNGREMVEVALAAQRVGLVACPLNTWAKPTELEAMMRNSRPVVIFYDTAHSKMAVQCAPENIPLIAVGPAEDRLPRSASYEALVAEHGEHSPSPFVRHRGTPKVVIQTSGTTGMPKAASRDTAASGLGILANLLQVVPITGTMSSTVRPPCFIRSGSPLSPFATALGATLVLPQKFDPESSLEHIEEHGCTAASFVPVMIRRILSLPGKAKEKYDLSSLRIVMASGSVLSNDVRRGATELFGSVIYDLYGSTEIGWVAIATPDDLLKEKHTVGRPVPGIEVRVVGPGDEEVATGKTGEIYVRSKVMFEGYISGESTKSTGDGWMSIGDLGHIDTEGFLYIEGRADDMVVVGGENVYPVEVEQVIENLDGVDEVAVLGVPDDEYGEILAAFVAGRVTEEAIVEACRKELASYKVPKHIHILDELPRNAMGKILKRDLAKSPITVRMP